VSEELGAIAVVVVRDGVLPAGADEAVGEADGTVLMVGSGVDGAAEKLVTARHIGTVETDPAAVGRLAASISALLADFSMVLLPASPDGRDLAPRLAVELDRPLFASAVRCRDGEVELARLDHQVSVRVALDGPAVVTLTPGSGGAQPVEKPSQVDIWSVDVPPECADAEWVETLPPDPATIDLGESRRILGGGAGLVPTGASGRETMALLTEVARALGASAGATRVVTDAGWMDYSRQIGTTGVVVDPDLYVAFGISGAAQHIGGLGSPERIVSVNTDPSCPMTAMADLGIVADAPAVLRELASRLGVDAEESSLGRGKHHAR
jgi:electron transfer flavoprotein alpha subunit